MTKISGDFLTGAMWIALLALAAFLIVPDVTREVIRLVVR